MDKLKTKLETRISNVEYDIKMWKKIKDNNGLDSEHLVQYDSDSIGYHLTYLEGYKDALQNVMKDVKELENNL